MDLKTLIPNKVSVLLILSILITACGGGSNGSTDNTVTPPTDNIPPVITITGANPLSINEDETYTELGATATDNIDGVVTVSITGNVDTDIVANYIVTYTAKDKSGNVTTSTREVIVVALSDQEKLEVLQNKGLIPTLERENTLYGIDNDLNGIRDDIDAYIESNYPKQTQLKAAKQTASALQKALTVDTSDIIEAKKVNREIVEAINCLYSKFDRNIGDEAPPSVLNKIKSITTNTKQRLLSYLAFSKALDGTSWSTPEGDTCE